MLIKEAKEGMISCEVVNDVFEVEESIASENIYIYIYIYIYKLDLVLDQL
jgi:hypothetical protein